ncbi:hypothetical protein MTR67_025581 [Solanum verrucosum]|uniref:Uncharacterized protein n=1 Tax=Solanum verrucosum TaxID=315347 RepID=A0AAF0TTN9_SOLVR|nr:hypothetical protein MTR67_025581 [Solanum verrucosum]
MNELTRQGFMSCSPQTGRYLEELLLVQAEEQIASMQSPVAMSKRILQMLSLFEVVPERLCEPFCVSTPVGESILAERVYRDCPISINHKSIMADLVELDMELSAVHPVFHIFMLKKYIVDPLLILPTKNIRITDSLSYGEITFQILDRQVRRLRTKDLALVKVLWRKQFVEEAIWEAEEDMKKKYPYLFESGGNADQGTNFLLSAL